jgi:hypothetical protein
MSTKILDMSERNYYVLGHRISPTIDAATFPPHPRRKEPEPRSGGAYV